MFFAFIFVMAEVPRTPLWDAPRRVAAPDSGRSVADTLSLRPLAAAPLYDSAWLAGQQRLIADMPPAGGREAAQQGPDTTKMDSLQLAIYHHNKAIDDSLAFDSLNRQKFLVEQGYSYEVENWS